MSNEQLKSAETKTQAQIFLERVSRMQIILNGLSETRKFMDEISGADSETEEAFDHINEKLGMEEKDLNHFLLGVKRIVLKPGSKRFAKNMELEEITFPLEEDNQVRITGAQYWRDGSFWGMCINVASVNRGLKLLSRIPLDSIESIEE